MANAGAKLSSFPEVNDIQTGDMFPLLSGGNTNAKIDYATLARAIIAKLKSEDVVQAQTNNANKLISAALAYSMNQSILQLEEDTSTEQEEKSVTARIVTVDDADGGEAGLTLNLEPYQSGSGDPSPDNVRPISGWTGVNVTRTGKNLFRLGVSAKTISVNGITVTPYNDVSVMVNGTNTAGDINVQLDFGDYGNTPLSLKKRASDYKITYFVKIKGIISGTYDFYGGYFDKNGVAHQFRISPSTLVETSTIPADAISLRTWFNIPQGASASNAIIEIQAELGSTATDYEPYQGSTYPITFPTEAGTVYGGSLDVTTGVLTVDRAMVDLGTLSWYAHQSYGFYTVDIRNLVKSPSGNAYPVDAMCSQYKVVPQSAELATDASLAVDTTGILYVNDKRYSDATAFKTAVSGVQLAFSITTPITYQLTPIEVTTLLGDNTIWMDAEGTIKLDYKANAVATKGDVNDALARIKALAKITEAIAPVESSYTATQNYAIGDYLIVDYKLYKVTAAITSGATITEGTNVTATTIMTEIKALT